MNKYKVTIQVVTYKDYVVKADDDSEAMDKAQTKAWREFNKLNVPDVEWETEIEEIDELIEIERV